MGKVLEIREVGDPVLERISEEVDINDINAEILDLIEDLKSTLELGRGKGIGIAAPQIGVNKRVIVIKVPKGNINYDNDQEIPLTVMINPKWNKLSEETEEKYEGCMSVPDLRGKVERYKNIHLEYYNEKAEKIEKDVSDIFARVLQHECDHLDGYVFIEKVKHNGFATIRTIDKFDLKNK